MNLFHGIILQKGVELFFAEQNRGGETGNFVVRIPGGPDSPLSTLIGRRLILGLRPQHVNVPRTTGMLPVNLDGGAGSPAGMQDACPTAEQTVVARVETVQPLGAEIHLHLRTGSHSFTAIAPAGRHFEISPKQSISMAFDMSKAYFFDPDTQLAISWRKL